MAPIAFDSLEPNVGIVNVPDGRLEKLGVINESIKIVPTSVRLSFLTILPNSS